MILPIVAYGDAVLKKEARVVLPIEKNLVATLATIETELQNVAKVLKTEDHLEEPKENRFHVRLKQQNQDVPKDRFNKIINKKILDSLNQGFFYMLNLVEVYSLIVVLLRKSAIFIAVIAASVPLFPNFPPLLSIDCCFVLSVNKQKITGTSV